MTINNANLIFANSGTKRSKTDTLCLHHTGTTAKQSVTDIHNYHRYSNGWAGIGYHYYVRKDGSVWYGRPDNLIGAHSPAVNDISVAVCFEGNFETEKMTDKQIKAGQEIVSYIMKKYPTIKRIVRHKDVSPTACPGKNFPFDTIKKGVSEPVKATATPTKVTATTPTAKTFRVKILDDGLNIRQSPSTLSKKMGCITDHGVYTIVETKGTVGQSGSWGKLKSGAGWISLYSGYAKVVQ